MCVTSQTCFDNFQTDVKIWINSYNCIVIVIPHGIQGTVVQFFLHNCVPLGCVGEDIGPSTDSRDFKYETHHCACYGGNTME